MVLPRALLGLVLAAGCSPPSGPPAPRDRFRLISIEPTVLSLEIYACSARFDRRGCDLVPKRIAVRTFRIDYGDDEGADAVAFDPDPWQSVDAIAHLCGVHAEQPVARRGKEARLLLEAADDLWKTECEAAIRIYRRLVLEYPEFLAALGARIRATRRAEQMD